MEKADGYSFLRSCRLCCSPKLKSFVDFGRLPLGNNLAPVHDQALVAEEYPLSMNRCDGCGHFQLAVAVDPARLFATNYTYLSGIGKSFVSHFKEYAAWVKDQCDLRPNALVVDIGSNDGTCLKEFQKLGFSVCGVDPASVPAQLANESGIRTLNLFFDSDAVEEILAEYGEADFVTSHNVLAHVADLRKVFENIIRLLKPGGFLCFEIGYFRVVLEKGYFDTIYHEHLDYHHASPLAQMLCAMGFDLLDISVNEVQGGSLRLLLKHTGIGLTSPMAKKFLDEEAGSILFQTDALSAWPSNIEENMTTFGQSVKAHVAAGKKVVAYGAPTKATLLMEMSKLVPSDILFVVEDNPLKVGQFLPKTGIPILNVDELQTHKPDVIVIFAWNFFDDIVAKVKALVDWQVTFIVPLPHYVEMS